MFVITEEGNGAINLDRCTWMGLAMNPETTETALVAMEGSTTYVLATGGDRPKIAAAAVMKAYQSGKRVIDLNDLLGAKPDIVIPSQLIVPPNGGRQ